MGTNPQRSLLSFLRSSPQSSLIMKAVLSLVLVALVAVSQAAVVPDYRECSMEIASKCVSEIGAAWDSCQDWTTPEEIMSCIENVIGATDCWDCVCTVLSFLPWCTK